MNKDEAIKLNDYIEQIFQLANEILYIGNNCGDEEVRKNIKRILSVTVAELDIKVLEPIYKQFPELRPDDIEELR
jgi:hypothetical protein